MRAIIKKTNIHMILFVIVSVLVPIGVYFFLPLFLKLLSGKKPVSRTALVVAGILFFVSWYLPSPKIQGEYTAFTTHFLGGGIFCGLVWLYITRQLNVKLGWAMNLLGLFFFVSGLGVLNELFELVITSLGFVGLNPSDTWWDLLANTFGAVSGVILYYGIRIFHTNKGK